MSFGFWPFSSDDSSDDQANGTSALTAYFDQAHIYPGFPFASPQEMIGKFESIEPNYAANIGELIRINSASETFSDAVQHLRELADSTQGRATTVYITQAAGGKGDTVNWMQAFPEIAVDSAKDLAHEVGEIAQNVGTGVLGTLKLAKYLPWFVVLGGGAYLYMKSKKKV